MQISQGYDHGHEDGQIGQITDLFLETFTASEGADEGRLIASLAQALLTTTPAADIRVFRATEGDRLIGTAIFTRLAYADDTRRVMLLSPMAVAPGAQRSGVGQTLLKQALDALGAEGTDVALTYGDPEYYRRVGFLPVPEDLAAAPLPLSMPHGWLGQALLGGPDMPRLRGRSACVPALNDPTYW